MTHIAPTLVTLLYRLCCSSAELFMHFTFIYLFSLFLFTMVFFFFLNDTAPTEIYPLPLHDALPISSWGSTPPGTGPFCCARISATTASGSPGCFRTTSRPGAPARAGPPCRTTMSWKQPGEPEAVVEIGRAHV